MLQQQLMESGRITMAINRLHISANRVGLPVLGSARDDEFGNLQVPPTGDSVTQSPYIVVADIDDHYAGAIAAGATITIEIKDEDYDGRVYSCRDPEGHLWNFGNYDPWAAEPQG